MALNHLIVTQNHTVGRRDQESQYNWRKCKEEWSSKYKANMGVDYGMSKAGSQVNTC